MQERTLTLSEEMVWWVDRASSLNFATVARVEGPVDEALLRAGLDALRARHAALRARIEPDERGHPWFRSCARPIPLEVVEGSAVAALERDLARRFDHAVGPLARCGWCPTSGELWLTFQHCASDGRSGVYAMRDLLTAMAAALAGAPSPLGAVDHPAGDLRLPRRVRRARFHLTAAGVVARRLTATWTVGAAWRADGARTVPRDVRLFPATLESDELDSLAARARAERTSVHGLLAAAQMQALAEVHDARVLGFASPVDLRPHLEPPVAEQVGYYIGASDGRFRVDPGAPPWPLARAVRARVKADVESGAVLFLNRFGPSIAPRLKTREPTPEGVAGRLYEMRGSSGLTNLGRLGVPEAYGPLRATSLHFFVATSTLGDQVATATSHGGRLFWNYCVAPDAVPPETGAAIRDAFVRRLRAAL